MCDLLCLFEILVNYLKDLIYVLMSVTICTYRCKFYKGGEEFSDEANGFIIDVTVDKAEEPSCFCNQVDRFDVVWLFS